MPSSVFVLLLLLAVPVASLTRFEFSGQVNCRLNRPFAYRISVLEEDFLHANVLSVGQSEYVVESPHDYNITASASKDGFSPEFEIGFEVLHSCNSEGPYRVLAARFHVGDYQIMNGVYYVTFDLDVTDIGKPIFQADKENM